MEKRLNNIELYGEMEKNKQNVKEDESQLALEIEKLSNELEEEKNLKQNLSNELQNVIYFFFLCIFFFFIGKK